MPESQHRLTLLREALPLPLSGTQRVPTRNHQVTPPLPFWLRVCLWWLVVIPLQRSLAYPLW